MKKFIIVLALACAPGFTQQIAEKERAVDSELARWKKRAENVTIMRDSGASPTSTARPTPTPCSACCTRRPRTTSTGSRLNYLNAMGRLAEVEGEAEIYRDLRMKLFIDPDDMKAQYAGEPRRG